MNDFQLWLTNQGYYRELGVWMKDGLIVSGKVLYDKLEEYKKIKIK